MPSPLNVTNIPSSRVSFIDPRTGLISREWYLFFLNLWNLTGGGGSPTTIDDLLIGPPGIQFDPTQAVPPFPIGPDAVTTLQSFSAELEKQIEGVETQESSSILLSQLNEMEKQIQGLESAPGTAVLQALEMKVASLQDTIQGLAIQPIPAPHAYYPIRGMFQMLADQYLGATDVAYPTEFDTSVYNDHINLTDRESTFTADIATTTMTVTVLLTGTIYPGMTISGTGVTGGTRIVQQLTGSEGDVGTYEVDISQSVASTDITGVTASQIVPTIAGVFQIVAETQFANIDGVIHDVDVWFRVNGVNLDNSNGKHTLSPGVTGLTSVMYASLAAGDAVEVMWCTSDLDVGMRYFAAQALPDRPVSPSITLTMDLASGPTIQSVSA